MDVEIVNVRSVDVCALLLQPLVKGKRRKQKTLMYIHDWTVRDWTKFHGVRDIANHRLERGVKVDSCN